MRAHQEIINVRPHDVLAFVIRQHQEDLDFVSKHRQMAAETRQRRYVEQFAEQVNQGYDPEALRLYIDHIMNGDK